MNVWCVPAQQICHDIGRGSNIKITLVKIVQRGYVSNMRSSGVFGRSRDDVMPVVELGNKVNNTQQNKAQVCQ